MGLLLAFTAVMPAQSSQTAEDGAFRVFVHGKSAGTESFSVRRSGDGISAASRIRYSGSSGAVEQLSTLRVGPDGSLIHYQWTQAKARIDVEWSDGHLNAHYQTGAGRARDFEFFMPATTAILDDNFYLYWELLADRYDRARGGAQTFRVFVPHTGDPGSMTLRPAAGKDEAGLFHLQAQSDAATIELFMKGSQLERLEMPSAGITVVRAESAGGDGRRSR